MEQRLMRDNRKERPYLSWCCLECSRIRSLQWYWRQKGIAVHDGMSHFVKSAQVTLDCRCGWHVQDTSMTAARRAWRQHVGIHPTTKKEEGAVSSRRP